MNNFSPILEVDVWYVATRKESGGNFLFHGADYLENYEREFERIREFDSLEEAQKALATRDAATRKARNEKMLSKVKKNIRAGKLRGDIRKGSVEDEETRAKIRAEILEELAQEDQEEPTKGASVGPKTRSRKE